ncbi:hypothetical protein Dsin_021695 [Dipteronia sinensis]|uniref:Uncharacterized protein n=1 Tax=Dipteronia sinensis TaxID=43782 RepID=A0AAE0DZ15_9ROSI|nr:hypothetical protein Dsin_021695 [Dipteronia sinensis]
MADLIVSVVVVPIVENVISTIASLIKEKVALVQGLKTDAVKLSSRLTSIQAVLKEAEKTQLENLLLRDWLAKLKNAAHYAEDVLDTLATKAALSKTRQAVLNIRYQNDAALKIKEILARIDDINEEKNQFDLKIESDHGGSWQEEPQTSDLVDTKGVCGREEEKEKIMELLLSDEDNEMSVIPIIGMGGLGKTTLAQLLFNDDRVKQSFERRMWVSVSVNFDLTRILRAQI